MASIMPALPPAIHGQLLLILARTEEGGKGGNASFRLHTHESRQRRRSTRFAHPRRMERNAKKIAKVTRSLTACTFDS